MAEKGTMAVETQATAKAGATPWRWWPPRKVTGAPSAPGWHQQQGPQLLQGMVAPKAFLLLAPGTPPPAQHGGLLGAGFQVVVQFQAVLRLLMGMRNFCLPGAEGRGISALLQTCLPQSGRNAAAGLCPRADDHMQS